MKVLCYVGLFVFLLLGDYFSKAYVQDHLPLIQYASSEYPYGGIPVFKGILGIDFSINYATNKGAAWGLFASFQSYLLYFRLALIGALLTFLLFFNKEKKHLLAFTLILSGAIGNVIDTFAYSYVIDMFYFKFGSYSYPIFNVADACIFCGTLLLFLTRKKKELPKHERRHEISKN